MRIVWFKDALSDISSQSICKEGGRVSSGNVSIPSWNPIAKQLGWRGGGGGVPGNRVRVVEGGICFKGCDLLLAALQTINPRSAGAGS
jgi:hypothetical protein